MTYTGDASPYREPKFELGQIRVSGPALKLKAEALDEALRRHQGGDWGKATPEETDHNEIALWTGAPLVSEFSDGTHRFMLITNEGRSLPLALLCEEVED